MLQVRPIHRPHIADKRLPFFHRRQSLHIGKREHFTQHDRRDSKAGWNSTTRKRLKRIEVKVLRQ